jgi:amino acid adenylation domain-containing protein/thioester reductase-like protein
MYRGIRLFNKIFSKNGGYQMNNIVEGFRLSVEKFPDNIAIKDKDRYLTYKELDKESSRVAAELVKNGLKKGEFVSIFLKRSIDTVVSILGILKAGGVYVALDPAHPEERNRYIIEDTQSPFLITKSDWLEKIKKLNVRSKNILLDRLGDNDEDVSVDIQENDLAYVIYTSGTTGNPKGTLLRHVGVLNLASWIQRVYNIKPEDRVLQFATFSFDASVYETFVSLFNGSTLYLIDDEERMSADHFLKTIDREGITVIPALPTVFFNQFSKYAKTHGERKFGKVRAVGVAGELLTGEVVRNFKNQFGTETTLFNLYGPTETTVAASYYKTPDEIDENMYSVPIGKAIDGTKLYVVNEKGERCKAGEVGELWIASVGISVGYLNKPEKTAEVFIKNPFEDIFEGMVYKSGDLVKELEDGNLVFVDRKDTQVKIRGHRIEIAEIENRMSQIKGIHDAVVVVEEDDGEKILKAFYTSTDEVDHTFIINELKKNLPSYMIPSKMKRIEELPFAPTGKVDRKKLAMTEADRVVLVTNDIVNPRNQVEEDILNAWKRVLNIEGIGVKEDFFEVGGHSLKIIEVLAEIKKKYRGLSIKDFFELRTVEKLAVKALEEHKKEVQAKETKFVQLKEYPLLKAEGVLPKVKSVVLTGATGFLGSHLLKRLTDMKIHTYAIVRGNQPEERLKEKLNKYFNMGMNEYIHVVNGDLKQRFLGLSEDQFKELACKIDAVIHSAADVRHFGDREHFEKVNVEGTKHVLELLDINPDLSFHHISTVGIVEDLLLEGKWMELEGKTNIPEDLQLNNVYTDTKLKAERLVLEKVKEGYQTFIYRMGNLTGRASDGVFQENIDSNAFYRMMKLMILVEKAPDVNWMVDFTPIDFASEVVTTSVLKSQHDRRVYHVNHPEPIHYRKFIDLLNEVGYKVEVMDAIEYEEFVLNLETSEEARNLLVAQLDGDGARDSEAVFDSRDTMASLGIKTIPEINKEYMRKLLEHAFEVGFIKTNRLVEEVSV